jgi:hypothetical protein
MAHHPHVGTFGVDIHDRRRKIDLFTKNREFILSILKMRFLQHPSNRSGVPKAEQSVLRDHL